MGFRNAIFFVVSVFLTPSLAHAQPADTLHPGDPSLENLLPHFSTDTIDGYKIVNGKQIPGSTQIRTIQRFQEKGEDVLLVTVKHIPANTADTTLSQIVMQTRDLSMIRQGVRSPRDSGTVTYALGVISGWVVPHGKDWQKVSVHVGRPVFPDDGLAPWIIGLLPLKLDYEAAIPFFNMWRGEDIVQTLKVIGEGEIIDGDRTIDCWKIRVIGQGPPGFEQTRWIAKDSRRMIKQSYLKGEGDPEYWSVVRSWY